MSEEGVEVDLKARYGVVQLEVAKHFWVQDTNDSNLNSLKRDREASSREESWVRVILSKTVIFLGEVGSVLNHDEIEKTVDNLEVAACIDDHSCDSADVLCASFGFSVANNGIANFEKFLGDVLRLVFLEAHQEAGQE